jgi:hypothetical protein
VDVSWNQDFGLGFELFTTAQVTSMFVGSPVNNPARGAAYGIALYRAGGLFGGSKLAVDTADASTVVGQALPGFDGPHSLDPALTTSTVGGFGMLNIPVGVATISGKTHDGKVIGSKAVQIRPGVLSSVIMVPSQ